MNIKICVALLIFGASLGQLRAMVDDTSCKNRDQCLQDNNQCKCYCSHKCDFRTKESDDAPVYVPQDFHGKYCYCKQWDLDNFFMKNCPR